MIAGASDKTLATFATANFELFSAQAADYDRPDYAKSTKSMRPILGRCPVVQVGAPEAVLERTWLARVGRHSLNGERLAVHVERACKAEKREACRHCDGGELIFNPPAKLALICMVGGALPVVKAKRRSVHLRPENATRNARFCCCLVLSADNKKNSKKTVRIRLKCANAHLRAQMNIIELFNNGLLPFIIVRHESSVC